MKRYIDADKLKEDFIASGLFDSGELGVILPIIEEQPVHKVATPHGDLIDRNTVNEKLNDNLSGSGGALWQAKKALFSAETIIEADG